MMKKLISLFCCVLLVFSLSSASYAAEPDPDIEYLADGSYTVTELGEDAASPAARAASSVRSKTSWKTKSYYFPDGTVQWRVKITGTFTYGNGSSKCTASSVSTTVYADGWKITSKSASKSGNKASATATASKSILGKSSSKTLTVTLTCSADGTFS